MEREGLAQEMRRMCMARLLVGALEVVAQHWAEVGVRAVLDDLLGALARRLAAQVGHALLRDDDVDVVLRLVNMRAEWHDGRDLAALGHRRRVEDGQVGVAREVAAAADAVDHVRARDVRRVNIAVDVDFDGRVHRNDAEAADDLRAVRDLLRAQDHVLLVLLDVLEEARHALRRRREGRARGEVELARIDEVEHAVLDDLRVDREVTEVRVDKARRDGVGDIADARLQG